MRALDPRLLRWAQDARAALLFDVALGFAATIALLIQSILVAGLVATAFSGEPPSDLWGDLWLLVAVVIVRAALTGGFETIGRRAGARVMSQLRLALTTRRLRDAPLASDAAEAGEVATAGVEGVQALEDYFARYLPQVVLAALVPAVVIVWTAFVDLTSALIMLVTLPLIPIFMVLIGRFSQARTRARWRALAQLSNHFLDVVRGLPTLRAFNRGEEQTVRIEVAGEAYRATTMQVMRVSFLSGAVMDLGATIATALIAVTLGVRLIGGGVSLKAALTVLLLTPELYAPLRSVAAKFHASADGLAAAERILDLIESPDTVLGGSKRPPKDWRKVCLESVALAYPGRSHRVLDDFDLSLERGEVVGLVGPSGVGKSTVASLLLGLRNPDEGAVTVDGVDLAAIDLAEWRRQIAWVPQRPTLFRASVRDNIALGAPGVTDSRIEGAAKLAGAHSFVRDFPLGYDTVIGDGGRGLSAGETRQVALARALVRNVPLLILDEPTANLDWDGATFVAEAVRKVAPGRAVLVIEHRLQLAAQADRVVRIEDGKAVEPAPQEALA